MCFAYGILVGSGPHEPHGGPGPMGPKGGPMGAKEGPKKGAQRKRTIFIDGPSMKLLMEIHGYSLVDTINEYQWISMNEYQWISINEFIDGPSMNSLMEIH